MRRWRVVILALGLFALPALACGAPTPTPKVQPGGGVLPTTAPTAAPVAASVGKVGDTVTLKDYAISLHAKQDPATSQFPASSGKRYVAYDVTITAITDNVAYNPFYASLKMTDNTEASVGFGGPDPPLKSGTLAKGESARGWLPFEIAANAQPATLTYQILSFGGEGKIQFDVR